MVGCGRDRGHELVEGGAEEGFGGAIVRRGVEGGDAEGEGARDDGAVGHGEGV